VKQPELSAVIVAWNSAESLAGSLPPLRRSAEAAGAALQIVVVDNASVDDSRVVAGAAGADVIVANPVNAGYVVAASQGIALANGEWVMLANPDLTVSEGFVGTMLQAAREAASDVACLVPDIRYAADPSVVNSRGIEVDAVGIPAESDAGLLAAELDEAVEVFGPSTSGCLIRRSALAEVGGLEPLYFAYLEDVDIGWRLRKKGYRALVVPGAVALHEGSASTGEGSWLKAFLVARNRRALFRLHGPLNLPARPVRAFTEIGHATVQALSGSGTASVHGRVDALRTRRYTRFLRASNRVIGIPDDAQVELAPRRSLNEALRRKRAAASLMRREDGVARPRTPKTSNGKGPAAGAAIVRPEGRLRVLVDATNLKPGQGGIRTYTIGLVQALAEQPELELIVAASVDEVAELGPMELVRISPRTRAVGARAVWRERNLAQLAGSVRADVVLSPVPELPLRRLPVPSVIVVHDVGPLVAPAFYSLPKKVRYQAVLPRACQLATKVVCVSHATLVGLHAATGIDPQRCEVIGEGPQLLDGGADGPPATEPYLLYVGSLEPRKNVETLVDAVLHADPPLPARLLLVGPVEGRGPAALHRRIEVHGGDRVRHLGFVSPERLTALYRDASALVLPSLYEGFGLPVLEAMKIGTPVVASDIPSVREVAGDAALYVSRPVEPGSWRDALGRISTDDALREDLSTHGIEAAEQFTWPQVGRSFSELLHRVAGVRPRPVRDGSVPSPARPGPEPRE
jgi:GT2 family glycosyltransferase/glycosyltransferase involved in cell wall biosynthesis